MKKAVLDASAMLAFLNKETGEDVVAQWLYGSIISAVNYTEVLQKLVDKPSEKQLLDSTIGNLRMQIVDFDREQAVTVASLYMSASKKTSFADRACIALGMQKNIPVLSGDRKWRDLQLPIELVFFRHMPH